MVKRLSMAFPVIFIAFITTIAQVEDLSSEGHSWWKARNLVIQITEDGKLKNEIWVADLHVTHHDKNKRPGAVWSYSSFYYSSYNGCIDVSPSQLSTDDGGISNLSIYNDVIVFDIITLSRKIAGVYAKSYQIVAKISGDNKIESVTGSGLHVEPIFGGDKLKHREVKIGLKNTKNPIDFPSLTDRKIKDRGRLGLTLTKPICNTGLID